MNEALLNQFLELLPILLEQPLYLTKAEYAKKWGISQTRLDEMISAGALTESNRALQIGCGGKGKHKHLFAFFNPFLGKISLP